MSETTNTTTAQAVLASVQTKLRARKDKQNAFGGYSYRNKEGILEAVKPLLASAQATITITEELVNLGARYYIKATACFNVGGESICATAYAREAETKKGMDEAQITGAASSYAGKYALCNLLAIDDSSVDPDANNDHGKRLPELEELQQLVNAETLDDITRLFVSFRKRGIAVGYLTELCRGRKAQLSPSSEQ